MISIKLTFKMIFRNKLYLVSVEKFVKNYRINSVQGQVKK